MSERNCSLSDSFEASMSERYSSPGSVSLLKKDSRVSPSIEKLIERLRILQLEAPRSPRAPRPTPAKRSPNGNYSFDSSINEDADTSSCSGISKLKKALEMRFNAHFSSPRKKHSSPVRDRHSLDNNTLKLMLAKEHRRRCSTDAEWETEKSPESSQGNMSPILNSSLNKTRSSSLQVAPGSPYSDMDSSNEYEQLPQSEHTSSVEHSLREISEVYSAFLCCNKDKAENRTAKRAKDAMETSMRGEEIFRQAVDVSLNDLVTHEQKEIVLDSYMRRVSLDLDQREEAVFSEHRDNSRTLSTEKTECSFENALTPLVGKPKSQIQDRDDSSFSIETDASDKLSPSIEVESMEEDPSMDESNGFGIRKWRSMFENIGEWTSYCLKKKSYSDSEISKAARIDNDDLLSDVFIKRLERSKSMIGEISSNESCSKDLPSSESTGESLANRYHDIENETSLRLIFSSGSDNDDSTESSRKPSNGGCPVLSSWKLFHKVNISRVSEYGTSSSRGTESDDQRNGDPRSIGSVDFSLELDDLSYRTANVETSFAEITSNSPAKSRIIKIDSVTDCADTNSSVRSPDIPLTSSNVIAKSKITDDRSAECDSTDLTRQQLPTLKDDTHDSSWSIEDDDVFENIESVESYRRRIGYRSFLQKMAAREAKCSFKRSPDRSPDSSVGKTLDGSKVERKKPTKMVPARGMPGNRVSSHEFSGSWALGFPFILLFPFYFPLSVDL